MYCVMIRSIPSVEGHIGVIKTRDGNVFLFGAQSEVEVRDFVQNVICILLVTVWTRLKKRATFAKVYAN